MWSEKEKQELYKVIAKYPLSEAFKLHAQKNNRKVRNVENWFCVSRRRGKIPKEVLNSIVYQRKPWSKEEEKHLLKLIGLYPHNFREAYRIHSAKYDRSVEAVKTYFFKYRKNKKAKVCALTLGNRKAIYNRKNIHSKTGGTVMPVKASKWKRILSIIFE